MRIRILDDVPRRDALAARLTDAGHVAGAAGLVITTDPAVARTSLALLIAPDDAPDVVLARVTALAALHTARATPTELRLEAAQIDLERGVVVRAEGLTRLSPIELELVRYLAGLDGAAATKADLEREVWGYRAGVTSHTVLTTVHRLRQKIERDPKAPDHLLTDRGQGYRLVLPTMNVARARPLPGVLHGRAALVQEAMTLLAQRSLVTLAGPGGVGKTRVAQELAHVFEREVVWCECADATTLPDLIGTLAAALGVSLVGGDAYQAMAHALALRPLVVLDNLEQVIAPARELIERLAKRVPLTIIATSREPLGLDFEAVLRLAPLTVEAAVALFDERRAEPAEHDVAAIVEIVQGCECLPLALELAAARARVMPLAELRRRLHEVLATSRGAGRHANLEENIRWSWNLASEDARLLLTRLSAFVHGATFAAAEAVAEDLDALELLDELVRKSLLSVRAADGETRFTMAESVRAFAVARGDVESERRAVEWLVAAAEQWGRACDRDLDAVRDAITNLRREAQNLRWATRWALVHAPAWATRLVIAQRPLWHTDGPIDEALSLVERARALAPTPELDLAWGRLLITAGRNLQAIVRFEACIAARPVAAIEAEAQAQCCILYEYAGRRVEAERALARVYALEVEVPNGLAELALGRTAIAWFRGQPDDGVVLARDAVAQLERLDMAVRANLARTYLGACLLDRGDHEPARVVLEQVVADGDRAYFKVVSALALLAMLAHERGDAAAAETFAHCGLVARRRGNIEYTALAMIYEAGLRAPPERTRLLEEAWALGATLPLRETEAFAAATLACLEGRDDARARAIELEPRLVFRREAVRCLLGLPYDREREARSVILRLAARASVVNAP